MQIHPLRLTPGQDLRSALQEVLAVHNVDAAFVLQGIGSLSVANLRYGGANQSTALQGDLEILTRGGSLSPDGVHLHIALSDERGHVVGGHVAAGCIIRTTAEILIALLPEYRFTREPDLNSGFSELVIQPAPDSF